MKSWFVIDVRSELNSLEKGGLSHAISGYTQIIPTCGSKQSTIRGCLSGWSVFHLFEGVTHETLVWFVRASNSSCVLDLEDPLEFRFLSGPMIPS